MEHRPGPRPPAAPPRRQMQNAGTADWLPLVILLLLLSEGNDLSNPTVLTLLLFLLLR